MQKAVVFKASQVISVCRHLSSTVVILKAWFSHQHRLETCWNCKFLGHGPAFCVFTDSSVILRHTQIWEPLLCCMGFPGSSAVEENACVAGGLGSIPGSGKSPREGSGYPLQYSWASLVTQRVKNPPAVWETWVWSLGWEDPLEKGMATHSCRLACRIPWTEEPGGL